VFSMLPQLGAGGCWPRPKARRPPANISPRRASASRTSNRCINFGSNGCAPKVRRTATHSATSPNGVDVPAQTFIDEITSYRPDVVGLSGFLTLAFDSMKETIAAIQGAGLRERLKIMIGGGQIDQAVCSYTGADAYGTNAVEAVALCKRWSGAVA